MDRAQNSISLKQFPNGRDALRRCYDCRTLLAPGEGYMRERGTISRPRRRLVCRDRAACEAAYLARRQQRRQQTEVA